MTKGGILFLQRRPASLKKWYQRSDLNKLWKLDNQKKTLPGRWNSQCQDLVAGAWLAYLSNSKKTRAIQLARRRAVRDRQCGDAGKELGHAGPCRLWSAFGFDSKSKTVLGFEQRSNITWIPLWEFHPSYRLERVNVKTGRQVICRQCGDNVLNHLEKICA